VVFIFIIKNVGITLYQLKRLVYILFLLVVVQCTALAQNSTPQAKLVKTYPNPATTYVYFDFQKNYDRGHSLQVYNFIGKKVAEVKTLSVRTTLNLDGFFRGMYYYQLLDRNNRLLETGKFQVVK
jgi:hypothetical protein